MSDDEHEQTPAHEAHDAPSEPKGQSLLLAILTPVVGLLLIGGFALAMGMLLLSMNAEAATLTALAVLVGLVLVTGLVARAKHGGIGGLVVMGATFLGVALLVGGASLATFGQPKAHEEEPGHEEPPGVVVTLVAKGTAFDPTELSGPAEPFTLEFDNEDTGVQHNVRIFEDDSYEGTPAFDGELITGVSTVAYEVPALTEGAHAFDCKVHPTMQGIITIAGGGGGAGASVTEAAKDVAFLQPELEVPADTPFTIEFDNQDVGIPHNMRIYEGETAEDPIHFNGEIITGPAKMTYAVGPLAAGSYLFDCEVHPNMIGTIVAKGGASAPPGGEPAKPEEPAEPPAEPPVAPPEEPSAAPPPPEEPAAGASSVALIAQDIAFDQSELQVAAGSPFTIEFDNQDQGIPHNVQVFGGPDTSAAVLMDGEIITGPAKATYEVEALEPGDYLFNCKLHPNMQGTITVS